MFTNAEVRNLAGPTVIVLLTANLEVQSIFQYSCLTELH